MAEQQALGLDDVELVATAARRMQDVVARLRSLEASGRRMTEARDVLAKAIAATLDTGDTAHIVEAVTSTTNWRWHHDTRPNWWVGQ